MKRWFELPVVSRSPHDGTLRRRRHPYATQTELNVLLSGLRALMRIGRDCEQLLELTQIEHEPEQQMVIATWSAPEAFTLLDAMAYEDRGEEREERLIKLAFELALALRALHHEGLIHSDLRPATVSCGPHGEIALFGAALYVTDAPGWSSPGWQDHLIRRAPEWLLGQRRGTARTDLYALGVLLFEQVAPLPRLEEMMRDLSYYTNQTEAFESLPRLGPVIMALLEPDYIRRCADVEELLSELGPLRGIAMERELCAAETWRAPQLFIGREAPMRRAGEALTERLAGGVTLIYGELGVGKSTFMQRLAHQLIAEHQIVILVQGRAGRRALIAQIQEELAKQMLYWTRAEVLAVRDQLDHEDLVSLAQSSATLASVFELEPRGAEEEHASSGALRLEIVAHALLHAVLAQQRRAMTLLVDDADQVVPGQGAFLSRLLEDQSRAFDTFHMAWSGHDREALTQIARRGQRAARWIELEPLEREESVAMIRAVLECDEALAEQVVEVIEPFAQGVPLWTIHMLCALRDGGALCATAGALRRPVWALDEEALGAMNVPDEVATLLRRRLDALATRTREVLTRAAACWPEAMLPVVVAAAPRLDDEEVVAELRRCLEQGLLSEVSPGHYHLPHTSLCEALLGGLSDEACRALHASCFEATEQLLSQARERSGAERDELHRALAHHAIEMLVHGEAARSELLEAIYQGWRSARRGNHERARGRFARYLIAYHLELTVRRWSRHSAEMLIAHVRDLCAAGEAGEAIALMERAIGLYQSDQVAIRARLAVALIELLTLNSFYEQALEFGRAQLSALGAARLEEQDDSALREACEQRLESQDFDVLRAKPSGAPSRIVQRAALLAALLPTSYISAPSLFSTIVHRLMWLNLEHPHTPSSSRGYSCYGQLLALRGEVDLALEFGQLALDLSERLGEGRAIAIACSDMANYIAHWTLPLSSSRELNLRGHREATRGADTQYAGYALMHDCYNRFFDQEPLEALRHDTERSLSRCYQLGNQLAIRVLEGLMILLDDLMLDAIPERSREDDFVARCFGEGNRMALTLFDLGQAMASYARHELDEAAAYFERARAGARHIEGWRPYNELYALEELALATCAHHGEPSLTPRSDAPEPTLIRRLAEQNPHDFEHKRLWLESLSATTRSPWERVELIELAFEAALRAERPFDAACIRMQAARFWEGAGRVHLGRTCRGEAESLWIAWGATAAAVSRFAPEREDRAPKARDPLTRYHLEQTASEQGEAIALMGNPHALLERALRELSASALSARVVALLLGASRERVLRGALFDAATHDYVELEASALEALGDKLPLHLLRKALSQQRALRVEDTRHDARTREDARLSAHGVLSLYALPVKLARGVTLLVYSDHNRLPGVFTAQREELVRANIPLAGLALESLQAQARRGTSRDILKQPSRRDVATLALLRELFAEVQSGVMLVEHHAASVSPMIRGELEMISQAAGVGARVLGLLSALTARSRRRQRHDLLDLLLVHALAPRAELGRGPRVELDAELFGLTLRTILELAVTPRGATPSCEVELHAHALALRLGPLTPRWLEALTSRAPRHQGATRLILLGALIRRAMLELEVHAERDASWPDTLTLWIPYAAH